LKFGRINLNNIVCACIELLEIKFHRKSVDYKVTVDSSLKEFSGDKGKLEQIIINLLLNALDSVADFGNIHIITHQKRQKGKSYAMMRIEDDGKGVPKKLLPHIFEPFYTTKTNGTGLGLANVKQIVEAHHGQIKVFNLKDKGTAFEVFLPLGETNG
jgi:signal transduction histidine kinase